MKKNSIYLFFALFLALAVGCAHYPANPFLREASPDRGYRLKKAGSPDQSDQLLFVLAFSGGGTRAAALSYGVMEELARTKVFLGGRERLLLNEVDAISSVSGGSFTAIYYGLFGPRLFTDFESRFLKKNVQKELLLETVDNSFRLLSSKFGRSDLAAEYYDRTLFEGATFGDLAAKGGPIILVNATDIALGTPFTFTQDTFDMLCSDLSRTSVARAVAASSAVPVLLTPITLYNYAGSCNYDPPEWLKNAPEESALPHRRYHQAIRLRSYLELQKRPYIHLMDGGIADNLGLRAAMDQITLEGGIWPSLRSRGWKNARKIVFILVNAEKEPDPDSDQLEKTLSSGRVMKAATRIPMVQYNFETVELLKENFRKWAEEIRTQRCQPGIKPAGAGSSAAADPCADIQFYLIEVDFDALADPAERAYFRGLPTSFNLRAEAVDHLRDAAHRILRRSPEFQRLLGDLR